MAWRFVLLRYAPLLSAFSLAWELLQLPLYTLPAQAPPRDTAYALLHCSAGDLLIGTGALVAALVITRARAFQLWRWTRVGGVAVVLGMAYTAFSEWLNAVLLGTWTYAPAMPLLPLVKIGLSPLLQWVFVPVTALTLARRLARGAVRSHRPPARLDSRLARSAAALPVDAPRGSVHWCRPPR
jgi:hypothetical protein